MKSGLYPLVEAPSAIFDCRHSDVHNAGVTIAHYLTINARRCYSAKPPRARDASRPKEVGAPILNLTYIDAHVYGSHEVLSDNFPIRSAIVRRRTSPRRYGELGMCVIEVRRT
jgi:hypothetical protein